MNSSTKRKLKRRRVYIWYVLVSAVFLWGAYVYLFVQRPALAQQEASKNQLKSELNASKEEYQNLNQQVQELHQNNYIAYIAQKKYNLVKPGEILFVANPAKTN